MPAFVLVTGLPASGKTTIAATLAAELQLTHLDKDAFLERLFPTAIAPSLELRAVLSRKADDEFRSAALREAIAVLSSWWRHPQAASQSGTAVDWLMAPATQLLEIHCTCSPSVALARFRARKRHPGHCDETRNETELERQFHEAAALGPLFPECALLHDTARPLRLVELANTVGRVRGFLLASIQA